MKKLKGGCYCGAIRYEIAEAPTWAAHCHCRSCQLALGGGFVTWAKVPAESFRVTAGQIKEIEKSTGIRRGFCGDCGTTMNYAAEDEVDGQDWRADAWFAAATLDDPTVVKPKSHVYVSDQQPWIRLADDLPRFQKF